MIHSKLLTATLFLFLLTACSGDRNETTETVSTRVVEVTALHDHDTNEHMFQLSSDEISSGWTTFQFQNASPYDHFLVIYKVPDEGIAAAKAANEPLLEHWFEGVTVPFQMEYNPYVNGDIDYGQFVDNLVASIMEKGPWFFDPGAPPMGGPGFTAAGLTSVTTVFLESGEYILECYVKNEGEVFHSYIGMLEHLTVTDDSSSNEEPTATISMNISSTDGIQVDQELNAGSHVVEITFEDQTSYEHLLGHNVQLVKLKDKENEELLSRLASWMDWRQKGSLVNRAPGGAIFMGGTMEMTKGGVAYFHVDLEPGDYAWIAEIPNPAVHGMLKTFTVSE